MTDLEALRAAVAEAEAANGPVGVIVNNAGLMQARARRLSVATSWRLLRLGVCACVCVCVLVCVCVCVCG